MANNVPKDATDDEAAGAIEAAVRKYIPEIVAFLLLEAIAIPFCHAGADAMLGGHVAQGIVGYLIGIPTGIAGLTFHWWKTWPIWRGIQQQVLRWWPAAILLAFAYVAGPSLYQRLIPAGASPQTTGRIVWNIDQAAQGGAYFLNMTRLGDQEIQVLGFQAHGKNNSDDPISQITGFMRSDLTNAQIPIYLHAQDPDESKTLACFPHPWIPTLPEQTFGVPSLADFDIGTYDKPFAEYGKDGIPLTQFINTFVPFTVSLEYDGQEYQWRFSKNEINRQVEIFEKALNPLSNPHVIRKANAAPFPLMPLHPLLPPQVTPMPPQRPDTMPTGSIPSKD